VIITQGTTTILEGSGTPEALAERVQEVKALIPTLSSDFDISEANKRVARLTGGVAVLSIGGATEVEQQERKHRVEDALSATKAAAAEGILPGGGTALLRAAQHVLTGLVRTDPDIAAGYDIILDAVKLPLAILAENAGKDGQEVVGKVIALGGEMGYNALTDEYEDLVRAKVIDPTLVTRSALENAVSVASMFLTLEGVIVKKPLDPQEKAFQAMTGGQ
jgi:chaperonin GroEL